MRYALLLCVSAFLVAASIAAPVPPPHARDVPHLIELLGSEDFAERETATKRLDELGLLALSDLRAATLSENAEIADRAKDLVRKIERRAANDRALAPTLVDLDLKDQPLDAVLAALSKQAECDIVLSGPKANEFAGKKVTIATGKVPFWAAVLKVCDAGELQIAGTGGFFAPGAVPYASRPDKKEAGAALRAASNPSKAVILETRDGKKRPVSVHGAVLVEAFELPKVAASSTVASAVLQVWPEPKLMWQSAADVKVTKATDASGLKLVPDFTPAVARPQVQRLRDGGVVVVRNADGTVTILNLNSTTPLEAGPNFTPNVRQAIVKLKTNVTSAAELTGSVYGLVRSPAEPLVVVALGAKEAVTATGTVGCEVTASLRTDAKGKPFVDVKLTYDPLRVDPVRTSDELPDVKLAANGNQSVHGLRVTDADGKAFDASLAKASNDFAGRGQRRIVLTMQLELPLTKGGPTVPTKLVFWGNYAKSVEVPFALKGVPLVGGAK